MRNNEHCNAHRDGTVSLQEYMGFMISRETENVKSSEEVESAFRALSAEGKPYVTKEELFQVRRRHRANRRSFALRNVPQTQFKVVVRSPYNQPDEFIALLLLCFSARWVSCCKVVRYNGLSKTRNSGLPNLPGAQ